METGESLRFQVNGRSEVGLARRQVTALARESGFDDARAGRVSIVVAELGTNLLKHASEGPREMLVRVLTHPSGAGGIEILALDRGPGIADVGRCMRDGYSSNGTLGTGLGAVRRLSESFDIYSLARKGTVVMARLWSTDGVTDHTPGLALETGVVSVPAADGVPCGDGWAVHQKGACASIVVADGLGHGEGAAEASGRAVAVFMSDPDIATDRLFAAAHSRLRDTRGAAMAVARLDAEDRTLTCAGIGNVGGTILGPKRDRRMVSLHGTVGVTAREARLFTYPWPAGALVVLHSDGISDRWTLDDYPGLRARDPATIATVLYRDFGRQRDDTTVVVVRDRHERQQRGQDA